MGVIRYRHDNRRPDGVMPGYVDGDLGRTKTQQAFLKACAKQALQLGNVAKVKEFVQIFLEHVETDIPLNNLLWFATQALGMDADTIQTCTMPNTPVSFHGGSYVLPNGEEILEVVNEQFNPYDRDITAEDLQLMVRHEDGSVSVTNGTLLDAKWGKPSSSGGGSSGASSGSGTTTPPPEETPDTPVDPADGETTDPGTGEIIDPITDEAVDPGTGEPAAPGGTEDPGTGEAVDPVTDEPAAPDSGGETAPDGDVTPDAGAVVDPGTGESPAPDSGTGTADTGSDVEGPAAPELPEDGGEDSEPPAWLGGDNG